MPPIKHIALAVTAALLLNACAGNRAEQSTPPPPLIDALMALEKSANEAWKTKDAKFWDAFLSDEFVGYGASGRLDKAAAAKELSSAACEINSYALASEQITQLDPDVALLTYKSTVDGKCGGQEIPAQSAAATVFVRDGANWKAAFHAESPIVDPKEVSSIPAARKNSPEQDPPGSTNVDSETQSLLAAEKAIWEAWKDADLAKLDALTTPEMSFINIFGTHFPSKAKALKDWTSHGCTVKSVSVTDPLVRRLSPAVAVLTFNGGADGTCFGQKIGPIWGTSIYRKNGDKWMWTFGINVPALQ